MINLPKPFLKGVVYLLIFINNFFASCSDLGSRFKPYTDIPSEDFQWMDKFFKDLMLKECGIYTLWGTKPMTVFKIKSSISDSEVLKFSEEEKKVT